MVNGTRLNEAIILTAQLDVLPDALKTLSNLCVELNLPLARPAHGSLRPEFLDWAKVLGQIEARLGLCKAHNPVWAYYRDVKQRWLSLGTVVGFWDIASELNRIFQCSYPRCPTPHYFLGGLFREDVGEVPQLYCGIRCQQA